MYAMCYLTIPPFRIMKNPLKVGECTFNVKIEIEQTIEPLYLHVISQCFNVESVISYELKNGEKAFLDANNTNVIDMKSVSLSYFTIY